MKKDLTPAPGAIVPEESALQSVPPELKEEIVRYLMPADAINFEAVSHESRGLIANNPKVWMQHGPRPPYPLAETQTLKQAWMSRARTFPPAIQIALSTLTRPLDIFSDSALSVFSSSIRELNNAMADIQRGITEKDFFTVEGAFDFALICAQRAGVSLPTVSQEMKLVYIEHMNTAMADIGHYAATGAIDAMEESVWEVETCAKRLGVQMPPLPIEIMKAGYLAGMQDYLETAQSKAKKGDIAQMRSNLHDLAELAKKAKVKMPSLSVESMNSETKIAYLETMSTLETEV
jgi:hypothetical protein